jgi:hypothetical protein
MIKEVSVPRVIWGFAIVLATVASRASSAMQTQPAAPGAQQMQTLPPVAPSVSLCVNPDVTTSLALLDRMQRVLDDAVKNEMGKISLDRPAVDELRAEVTQIRRQLQPVKP